MRIAIYFMLLFCFCSCDEETSQEKKLITVRGKLIDSTRKINYANHEITASFVFESKVKNIANAKVDSNGEFKIEYYTDNNYQGNNLRLTFWPTIPWFYKFDYLPYGVNWTKVFYLSDSAKIVFKNKF